jgi:transposase InsO family protein
MATGLRVEDILDGVAKFGAWKERMILLLQEDELWDIVENIATHPLVVPTNATLLAAYTKKSIKAKRIILDAIKDHLIPHLMGKSNAYDMWESLTKLYQSTNENRKMVLREKLKRIKMTKDENVVTYLTRLTQVRDELGYVGEAIVDSDLVRTTLYGVSKQWVVFVEGIVDREKPANWEHLWDEFVHKETQRGYVHVFSSTGHDEENVALSPYNKKKFIKGPKGGNKPKGEGKKDISKFNCFVCHKFGHYVGQCPNKKKKQKIASTEVEKVSTKFDKEFSLVVCLSTRTTHSYMWYIDSGASRHMAGVRENLKDLTQIGDVEVLLGYDQVFKAVGCGIVSIQRECVSPMLLREVLYVPSLKKNLVSIFAIEERGYEVLFRDGQVLLFPKGSSINSAKVFGTRHEKLYKLMFHPVKALFHSTSNSDLCELWHRRMAHLHHGALRVLREIVIGVPYFSTEHQELCKGFDLGKYTKTSFPSSDNRAAGILDLIHSDLCGLMSSTSLTGFIYYVIFIDEFSWKCWILFMKTKGQVFSRFQEFKALVENQMGKKIRVLRIDNGDEYTSKEFMEFCAGEGIMRELIVPYNPLQNGVVERKNKAIVGVAKAMLHD